VENCVPKNYEHFLRSVLPERHMQQQKSWNFGVSVFNLDAWRQKNMTKRYEDIISLNYEKHIYPETSLAFGLGMAYLAFAGEVRTLKAHKSSL
jgi:lipopolysaccharide biosynthesis glycosyltransferase